MVAVFLMIPFLGTVLGSALVFLLKDELSEKGSRVLTGFASGVMVAASIWSLIIPALTQSSFMGRFAFVPAVVGFWIGIVFLLFLDSTIPHLHLDNDCPEGVSCHLNKTTMMVLAVAMHNIPEGMAVGVVCAGWISGNANISFMGALALAIGIAIQNLPEGAIVSMPLHSVGTGRKKSFGLGVLSGLVEPAAAFITILLASILTPILPYLLSFAAGAMIYVVVEELIPEMSSGNHSNIGVIAFTVGFTLMLVLDTALA